MLRPTMALLLLATPSFSIAQTPAPRYPAPIESLPDSAEIVLATSAAPAVISGRATVYALKGGKHVVIRAGDNGASCMVARDAHEGSLYPICFDAEGTKTELHRELMGTSLRAAGVSEDEVVKRIAAAYQDGTLRRPERMSVAYMMSPRQVLFSSPRAEGRRVGAWWPHLMIRAPGLTAEGLGLNKDGEGGAFSVDNEGGAPQLIVRVPHWSDGTPRTPPAPKQ